MGSHLSSATVVGDDDATSTAALTSALSMVGPAPISAYSAFWQTSLTDAMMSVTAHVETDPTQLAELLERAATDMSSNTLQSGNLHAMCTVLCMALEQYTLVQKHAADVDASQRSFIPQPPAPPAHQPSVAASIAANVTPPIPPTLPQRIPPPEPLHLIFERIYRRGETVMADASPELLSAPPPDWLLDLLTLARLFLQHIIGSIEYGPRKIQLLSLRRLDLTGGNKRSPSTATATAGSPLPRFTSHTSTASASPVDLHSDLSYRLVHALLTALTDIPLAAASNEDLHVELLNLLLVLLSAQMYVPMSPLYASANIFLAHALCGPFARGDAPPGVAAVGAGRCAALLKKLSDNCTAASARVQQQLEQTRHVRNNSVPSTPSSTRISASSAQNSFEHAMASPSGSLSVSVAIPAPASATSPSSHATSVPSTPRLGGLTANGTDRGSNLAHRHTLHHRLQQAAGLSYTGQHHSVPFLKRLGNRLFSLLLFPVSLLKHFFAAGGHGFSPSTILSSHADALLAHDGISVRSNLLLLLLVHQGVHSIHTPVNGGATIEDPRHAGRSIVVGYVHREARNFDWRRWRDEDDIDEDHARHAAPMPYVPSARLTNNAAAASSMRATAPAMSLPSLQIPDQQSAASIPVAFPCVSLDANPYKHALSLLRDEADEADDEAEEAWMARTNGGSSAVSPRAAAVAALPTVHFALLYDAIASSLPSDLASLLLYALLNSNATWREHVLVRTDIERIILPLIQAINDYSESGGVAENNSTPSDGNSSALLLSTLEPPSDGFRRSRLYLHLILLLILSEDRALVDTAHRRILLPSLPWMTEASHARDVPLASALLLVLLKLAHANCFRRDPFVATNAAAIMQNFINNAVAPAASVASVVSADAPGNGIDHSSGSGGGGGSGSIGGGVVSSRSAFKLHPNVVFKLISMLGTLGKKYSMILERQRRERADAAAAAASRVSAAANPSATGQQNHSATAPSASGVGTSGAPRINLAPPSTGLLVATQAPINPSPEANTAPIAAAPGATSAASVVDASHLPPSNPATDAALASFASFIRLLLELVSGSLRERALASNIYLLYTLVQSVRILEPLKHTATFGDLADPLLRLCDHATRIIQHAQAQQASGGNSKHRPHGVSSNRNATPNIADVPFTPSSGSAMSVEELMQLLKSEVRQLQAGITASANADTSGAAPAGGLLQRPAFVYEEQASSEEFFVPFVWELAWNLQRVAVRGNHPHFVVLFQPHGVIDDEHDGEPPSDAANTSTVQQPMQQHQASVAGPAQAAVGATARLDVQDELLAAEMESAYREHILVQHLGDAQATPAPRSPVQSLQLPPAHMQLPPSEGDTAAPLQLSNAGIVRRTEQ